MSNAETSTSTDFAQAARWFQALSDETRLRIVEMLADGECCVCDLQSALDAYQSRLSFHLKKLKEAGVVNDRKEGRWVYYSLNEEMLEAMAGFLHAAKPRERGFTGPGGCCR